MLAKQSFYGMNMNDIGKRAHVLQHSYGRCVVSAYDKNHMKYLFVMYLEIFYPLSSTNTYIFILYIMVQDFIIYIYNLMTEKKIDDDGSGIFPKTVRNIYNAKYQATYSNRYYVIRIDYIKI